MTTIDNIASLGAALAPRYAVERELGRGGMATVYLALDLKLHRQVALKVLRPELTNALGPERFLREIQIVARLSHPHILSLHDSGEADGRLFYAMPYVEGESLRQRLAREPQLPVDEVVRMLRTLAGALDHAHKAGVIHRDLKPENILLASAPQGGPPHPMLADFGLARAWDAADGERLTQTGLALGTPAYMSPEQGAAGPIDARSDLYALGCVAYEMLAGAPPFTGPTQQAILARHAVDPVPPLRTVRQTVPATVERAIARALAKVPADRFETASEFASALTEVEGVGLARRRSPVGRRRAALVLGAAAAAIGAGFIAIAVGRPATPAILPSAATIAVLPFGSPGGDTALNRLGRDLAVTVGASLDRVGGITTADRLVVANETENRGAVSSEQGATLARRLGAGSFVRGSLVGVGENVRLDVGLYDANNLAALAPGLTVFAPRDSLGALTDSVVWALLRHVWQRGDPPTPSVEAITTRSLPALRAFLDGERELAANRWEEAGLGFRAAITADSTFALAHFRYALSQVWLHGTVEPAVIEALRLHRTALPERDRLLVVALLDSMSVSERIQKFREVTERFPEYWPGWFLYGDIHMHGGPKVGYDWSDGLAAFHRVVALNPKLIPAWEHMTGLTYGRDTAEDSRILVRLGELGWRGVQDLLFRVENAVFRAGGVIPSDSMALADSLAALMVSSPDPHALERGVYSYRLLRAGFPAAQLQLNRRALRLAQAAPQTRVALRAANAWAWAARGRWDSALATLGEAALEHPGVIGPQRYSSSFIAPVGGPPLAIENYGLAVLGAWLGAVDARIAEQRRPGAIASIATLMDEESRRDAKGRIAWLDGVLGFARGDRSAIVAARRTAGRTGYVHRRIVDRSLAAFEEALAGNRHRAGRVLADIEEDCANHESCSEFTPSAALHRLAAGQWLMEAGEVERARRLLRWYDGRSFPGWLFVFNDVLAVPSFLVRARLEEVAGDRGRAVEYYRQVLRRYDEPVPTQASIVEEARAALARLEGDR